MEFEPAVSGYRQDAKRGLAQLCLSLYLIPFYSENRWDNVKENIKSVIKYILLLNDLKINRILYLLKGFHRLQTLLNYFT